MLVGFYTRAAMPKPADLVDEDWSLYSSGGGAVVRPSAPSSGLVTQWPTRIPTFASSLLDSIPRGWNSLRAIASSLPERAPADHSARNRHAAHCQCRRARLVLSLLHI